MPFPPIFFFNIIVVRIIVKFIVHFIPCAVLNIFINSIANIYHCPSRKAVIAPHVAEYFRRIFIFAGRPVAEQRREQIEILSDHLISVCIFPEVL